VLTLHRQRANNQIISLVASLPTSVTLSRNLLHQQELWPWVLTVTDSIFECRNSNDGARAGDLGASEELSQLSEDIQQQLSAYRV
jgi:hypothetical protein